ncbi:hypothetical protein N7490_003203 [Penicillium lividum]|nr:hypothetical protein N7490_003203 [Penicillium lividum]
MDSSSRSPTASATIVDEEDFDALQEDLPLSSYTVGASSTRHTSETRLKTPEIETDESESEDSSDDADDELYNFRQESLPSAPLYDQRLQTGLKDVKSHLADLVHAMGASDLVHDPNSSLHKLRSDAKIMSEFQYPEKRTVGFIGDSGVGKSSLINCLLDQINLAKSSGEGSACTCVVTEFRNVDDDHQEPFTVEADYMNAEERSELLQELIRSVRQFYTSAYQDVTSTQEQQQIRDSATKALKTLQSVFQNKPDMGIEFLAKEEEGAEGNIQAQLEQWTDAELARKPGGLNAMHYMKLARNLKECRENLDFLTADSFDEDRPVLWPFIKIIRVYLDSSILRTGLVLADLPVCTQSEDVSLEESTLEKGPAARTMQQFSQRATELKSQIKKANKRIVKAISRDQERNALRLVRLQQQESELRLEIQAYLMNRRNENARRQLAAKYNNIQVFCISNTLYRDHREDPPDSAEAYLKLSGILDLRRYCQLVPAEAGLRATRAFLTHQVPALLGSIRQWVLAGSDAITVEKAATLRRALKDVEMTLHNELVTNQSEIRRFQESLHNSFRQYIFHIISISRSEWMHSCLNVSGKWSSWHHSTYAAFCRNNGTYSTKAAGGFHCWNDELVQKPRQDLSPGWEAIMACLESQADILSEVIVSVFNNVCGTLREHVSLAPQTMQNFLDNMEFRQSCIIDHVQDSFSKIIENIGIMRRDMLEGHDSSYIGDLIRPAYAACSMEGGTGSDRRRKDIMRNHLRNPGLFGIYLDRAKVDYSEVVSEQLRFLRQKILEQVVDIKRDSHTVVAPDNEAAEADRAPEVARGLDSRLAVASSVLVNAQTILQEVSQA